MERWREAFDLLDREGGRQYGGEAVSQLEHALQCAALAAAAGAAPALIAAALLHDLGHLVPRPAGAARPAADDLHEAVGADRLARWFGPEVVEPVRLHVPAKRYLCAVEPAYHDSLSPESQRSLLLQGGTFSPAEAQAFIARPHAADAVRLRRWDDLAKLPGRVVPGLDAYREALSRLASPRDGAARAWARRVPR